MFRPRSGMAKVLYEKIMTDQRLQAMDKAEWYRIDQVRMQELSQEISEKFEQFEMDENTQLFLDSCVQNSDNTFWQLWLTLASSILSWFLTNTSVNGLLGRGSMQVFSPEQFERLIDYRPSNSNDVVNTSLLDIGAGDGSTTEQMAAYFKDIYVTEMSTTMRWTLQKKGYTVLDVSEWASGERKYDVISCLNVLDRCEKPITLLNQIRTSLKPNGVAVLAFVIPFKPYVEFGEDKTHEPAETVDIEGETFEEEVTNFVKNVLNRNGWELVKWTRLPYLCEGNIQQAFYWLDDALFVVKPKECTENVCEEAELCPGPSTSFWVSKDR